MAKVDRLEDLIAWQKARVLTGEIYKITQKDIFAKDFGLSSQIRRASVSIMSNIAEGFERNSASDFHRFLVIAKSSCAEVRSQLYVARDVHYLTSDEFDQLMALGKELSRILGGLRRSVDNKR